MASAIDSSCRASRSACVRFASLCPRWLPAFASLSARSFPWTPTWPGTCVMTTSIPFDLYSVNTLSRVLHKSSFHNVLPALVQPSAFHLSIHLSTPFTTYMLSVWLVTRWYSVDQFSSLLKPSITAVNSALFEVVVVVSECFISPNVGLHWILRI